MIIIPYSYFRNAGPVLFSREKYGLKAMRPKNPGFMAKAGVKVAIQAELVLVDSRVAYKRE